MRHIFVLALLFTIKLWTSAGVVRTWKDVSGYYPSAFGLSFRYFDAKLGREIQVLISGTWTCEEQ